jgi:hypothetical protein
MCVGLALDRPYVMLSRCCGLGLTLWLETHQLEAFQVVRELAPSVRALLHEACPVLAVVFPVRGRRIRPEAEYIQRRVLAGVSRPWRSTTPAGRRSSSPKFELLGYIPSAVLAFEQNPESARAQAAPRDKNDQAES